MMDAKILGDALDTVANQWNDKDIDNLPAARTAYWESIAQTIIDHITNNGEISVTVKTTGTASAQSGTGSGKMK